MAEKEKDEATNQPGINDLQSEIAELRKTIQKREESIAFHQREVEKLKEAKTDRDQMVKDKANTGDQDAIKKLEKTLREEAAAREDALNKKIAEQAAQLKHERVIAKAVSKAAGLFNDDALDLIQSKIERFCDEEDGEIIIKDDKGKPRYNGAKLMTVDDFLGELVEKHPSCAKPKGQPGTKQPGQKYDGSNGPTVATHELLSMSEEKQRELIGKMSPQDAAKALNAIFNPR